LDDIPGFPNNQAGTSSAKVTKEWDALHQTQESLLNSSEIKRVRSLRNNDLAHSPASRFRFQ